jgi:hypothetical protein
MTSNYVNRDKHYKKYSRLSNETDAKKKLKEEAKLAGRMTSILKSMHSPRSYALPS